MIPHPGGVRNSGGLPYVVIPVGRTKEARPLGQLGGFSSFVRRLIGPLDNTMPYQTRFTATDPNYLRALGQAIFSFAALEYQVMNIIEKLEPGYINQYRASRTVTAMRIAGRLKTAVGRIPSARRELSDALLLLHNDFERFAKIRNDLLHANPATLQDGTQGLVRQHFESRVVWDIAAVDAATEAFETAAVRALDIFFNQL
jgi:hypothetical protein